MWGQTEPHSTLQTSVRTPKLLLTDGHWGPQRPATTTRPYLCGLRNQLSSQSQVLSDWLGLFTYGSLNSEDEALRIQLLITESSKISGSKLPKHQKEGQAPRTPRQLNILK